MTYFKIGDIVFDKQNDDPGIITGISYYEDIFDKKANIIYYQIQMVRITGDFDESFVRLMFIKKDHFNE